MGVSHPEVVERLLARVARTRASGGYDRRILDHPFTLDPAVSSDRVVAPSQRGVRLRHELGFSSRPVVGPAISLGKRALGRAVHNVVQDGLDQAALGIEHLDGAVADLRFLMARESARRARLEVEVAELREQVTRLSARPEAGDPA